jgi:hypothetical protein
VYIYGTHLGLGRLGQDDSGITASITDNLPDAYSDTSTLTGLPVIWEIGIAGLAAILLWSATRRAGNAVRSRAKKTLSKAARRL